MFDLSQHHTLQFLNVRQSKFLNQMLPKAIINRGDLDIASPNRAFWDIKCERSDIFQDQQGSCNQAMRKCQ